MKTSFYITENRLSELKSFIRAELPTVRFNHNPLKVGKELNISLSMSVEDGNKLSTLQNKWYEQDNPEPIPNKSIWSNILSIFN